MLFLDGFYRILRFYPVMVVLIVIVFICFDLTRYGILNTNDLSLTKNAFTEPWRLLTYSIVHIDIPHFMMNLLAVYVLTPYLFKTDQVVNQITYFFGIAIAIGIVCYVGFLPNNPSGAVGLSGVVFAMIGSLWINHKGVFIQLSILAGVMTVWWIHINEPIYNSGHVVGYFCGAILGPIFIKSKSATRILQR